MANIFQRFGTKAVQYQIDIILNELVINVEKQVEMTVLLKRGDHKSESKIPVPLRNFRCKFNKQTLTVPTKLYWDEKKKEFLSKLAELQINLIHDKKVRCAGKVEFDVAQYANNKIMSKNEQSKLQKCPDPNAKLLYEIRVHKFGDTSYYDQKEREEQQIRAKAKSSIVNNRGKDVSPMTETRPISARQKIPDLDEFNARSKSPITKLDNKRVSFRHNDSEQDAKEEAQLKSNLFSLKKPNEDTRNVHAPETSSLKQSDKEVKALKSAIEELKEENSQLKQEMDSFKKENQRLKSKVETYENSNDSPQNIGSNDKLKKAHKQEIQSFEEQVKSLNEQIKQLRNKENPSDDSQKYLSEKKIKDLEFTVEELKQKIKDLQAEIQKKQKDVDYYKDLNNRRNKEETDNEHMLDLQKQVQELEKRLETQEKNADQKIKDLQEENMLIKKDKEQELQSLRRIKSLSDNEISKAQKEKEDCQKLFRDLESKYKKLQSNFTQSKEERDFQNKFKDLQSKYDDVNSRLMSLSTSASNLENENKNLKLQIKNNTEDTQNSKQIAQQMENKLKQTKESFCHILNIILEKGDAIDIIDDIEPYLVEPEQSEQDQNQPQFTNTSAISNINPTPEQFQNNFMNDTKQQQQQQFNNFNNNFTPDNHFNY